MRSVEKFDILNPEHAGFMYDLAMACREDFMNDHDNDILLIMSEYERQLKAGTVVAFLALQDEKPAGIIWVELDRFNTGRLRAGLMPQYRQGYTAMHFFRQFIDFCFEHLDVRKLDAEIVMGEKFRDADGRIRYRQIRTALAAEKLLRRFGFKKEGQPKEALMIDGKPRDTLLFGFTRNQYKGRKAS
jgi:RimJ/RimL family protein N-acetyltransferase